MSREVPALGVSEGLVQAALESEDKLVTESFNQVESSETDSLLDDEPECNAELQDRAVRLQAKDKVALIRRLITQLETDHIQAVLEFGLREIGDRYRRGAPSASGSHNTRLLLKKDYSYQERGLSQPTQYYVYLRRRKPKLDRYIGTLFYIPEGCALSYFLDAEGRIVFNPPHNIFQLRDCTNPAITQVVRLICLEPPPPNYTFTKQQNDTPEMYLHLEYLDPKTFQSVGKQAHPFPGCMHEGGALDRYRWEVSALTLSAELETSLKQTTSTSISKRSIEAELPDLPDGFNQLPISSEPSQTNLEMPQKTAENAVTQPLRQVLELPVTKPLTFYLYNQSDSDSILKRMRQWVFWSEKAMPQSKWEIVQDGTTYTLLNAHFKRRILRFSRDRGSITLENSLPVLVKWFHDLSLAVSQAQNQRQYSTTQLNLAHSLFVNMSLPQKDPIVVLQKLFGVEFCKTPNE